MTFKTARGNTVEILHPNTADIRSILFKNRNISPDKQAVFLSPDVNHLYDPFLMPDMQEAVERIFCALERGERIVIFWDYDVDWVSSTTLLVSVLHKEFHAQVSYRLPHRMNDWYGLKKYFFDDLADKWVTLVITVDCWTRDIEPIRYAKSLGIDVIVTDHHAVPEEIPEEVIAIINPKRTESVYPFSSLAWAWVAFKLVHALLLEREKREPKYKNTTQDILLKYIDIASLGTVADCMPLIDENRIITTLWLQNMKQSSSSGLRKFVENIESLEGNADVIGFQIWPRINASWRMDTPLTALRWLLSPQEKSDIFLEELEALNQRRRDIVEDITTSALESIENPETPIWYYNNELEHGIIGLIAGKLTEKFNLPSFVLCDHEENGEQFLVASCRAPEWCNIVEILDSAKDIFVRYWGHKQAAGFTIRAGDKSELEARLDSYFTSHYPTIPLKTRKVEWILTPQDITLQTLETIESFKPFWIGNPKPVWIIENLSVTEIQYIGSEKQHAKIFTKELPNTPLLFWNIQSYPIRIEVGDTISFSIRLDKNVWNNRTSLQLIIEDIIYKEDETYL